MTAAVDDRRTEPAATPAADRRRARAIGVATLALLSYLPALTASPGRMPSDSKLFLYLDPGRLISDGRWSFDARQFGGWVPHQHITFVWPSGPWFWTFERLGVPDWVAHRLWIGTLLFAAGTGVGWCARRLGLSRTGAMVAAVVYLLSPYLLAYVSRTSVMLLPWAGLGWIVGATVRSTLRGGWRGPAVIALLVATVGSVNVTALLMIVPAPALWLVHAGLARIVPWSRVAAVAWRTAALTVPVSAWWITMSVLQRRYGAPVLDYSETLEDVATSATAPEVLRGLGYWLFYVRDAFGATTEAALPHLASTRVVATGFVIVVLGAVAAARVRWRHRRLAVAWIGAGLVLGVGVHPVHAPSPFGRVVAASDQVALALRSSTRAAPVLLLGVALLLGAWWGTPTRRDAHPVFGRVPRGPVVVALATALALANLPAWWNGGFVDPGIRRDQDPPTSWVEAAAAVDERGSGQRVLQVPGSEFGSFRWGHTVDQPLVSLTDAPLVTRDLLPLGSPGLMDLLYALDDTVQDGTLDPRSVAPVARLLGVGTIWLANDLAHERYRTARPEPLDRLLTDAPGIDRLAAVGPPRPNVSEPPRLDERALADPRIGAAAPDIVLFAVDDPPGVIRVKDRVVAVSGSGAGIVDAAAVGLVTGHELVVLSAHHDPLPDGTELLVVTDSFRDGPRHWRGSRETHGPTRSVDERLRLLDPVAGDRELDVATDAPARARTTAEQQGWILATASRAGPAFSWFPERRPYAAVDGDRTTSWTLGAHEDPVGERLRLIVGEPSPDGSVEPPAELVLVQPEGDRHVTAIRLERSHGEGPGTEVERVDVELDPALATTGQRVTVPPLRPGDVLDLVITGVSDGHDPVGFAEVLAFDELGITPTVEVVVTPTDAVTDGSSSVPTAYVLTRWRADPTDRDRRDPEPRLVRRIQVPAAATMEVRAEVRIDPHADDVTLTRLFGSSAEASARLHGVPTARGHAAVDGDPSTAWITPFGGAEGATLHVHGLLGPTDRIHVTQPGRDLARITSLRLEDDLGAVDVALGPRADDDRPDTASVVELPRSLGPGPVRVTITGTDGRTTRDRRSGREVDVPAGISELDFGVPLASTSPLTDVTGCRDDLLVVDGDPVPLEIALPDLVGTDAPASAVSPCDDATVQLEPGPVTIVADATGSGLMVDRVVLRPHDPSTPSPGDTSPAGPTVLVTGRDRLGADVTVSSCVDGCWFVHGEGYAVPWRATVRTVDGRVGLGPPVVVDGGANGWWVPPEVVARDGRVQVRVDWTAQRPLDVAWLVTILGVLLAAALVAVDRRRPPPVPTRWAPTPARPGGGPRGRAVAVAVTWVVTAAVFVGPLAAGIAAIGGIAVVAVRRRRVAEWIGVVGLAVVAVHVIVVNRRDRPPPNLAWPDAFSAVHGLAIVATMALVSGAWWSIERDDPDDHAADPVDHGATDG